MRRLFLALFLCVCTAVPAIAYAPSGKPTYTRLETELIHMVVACRSHLELWRQFNCLMFVDRVRQSSYTERLSPGYRQFINTTRVLMGF